MTPILACIPMLMFLAALGLLTTMVVVFGIYNRTEHDAHAEPTPKSELTWPWIIAILITIVVPLGMLLVIWLLPEW